MSLCVHGRHIGLVCPFCPSGVAADPTFLAFEFQDPCAGPGAFVPVHGFEEVPRCGASPPADSGKRKSCSKVALHDGEHKNLDSFCWRGAAAPVTVMVGTLGETPQVMVTTEAQVDEIFGAEKDSCVARMAKMLLRNPEAAPRVVTSQAAKSEPPPRLCECHSQATLFCPTTGRDYCNNCFGGCQECLSIAGAAAKAWASARLYDVPASAEEKAGAEEAREEDAAKRERCSDCDKPLATDAEYYSDDDLEDSAHGLCWRQWYPRCQNEPVDWRSRALKAEADLERNATTLDNDWLDLEHERDMALARIADLEQARIGAEARIADVEAQSDAFARWILEMADWFAAPPETRTIRVGRQIDHACALCVPDGTPIPGFVCTVHRARNWTEERKKSEASDG